MTSCINFTILSHRKKLSDLSLSLSLSGFVQILTPCSVGFTCAIKEANAGFAASALLIGEGAAKLGTVTDTVM